MSRRTVAIVAGSAVLVLLVVGLVALLRDDPGTAPRGPRAGTAPTVGATTAPPGGGGPRSSATPGSPPGVPRSPGAPGAPGGGDEGTNGFLAELGAIDPGLVADTDRAGAALRAGKTTCQDIKDNRPADEVVREAMQRFRAPGVTITEAKATLLVDAARNHLCPG